MKKILLSILFLLLITSCSINLEKNDNKKIGSNSINNATSEDIYEKISKCQKGNSLIDINCINGIFPDSIKSNEALVASFEEMNKCNSLSLSNEKELYSKCLKNIYINYSSNLFGSVSLCTSYFVVGNYDETISCINNINDHTITTLEGLKGMSYVLKGEVEKGVNICKESYIKNPLSNTLKKCIETGNKACIFNGINYQVPENAHCLVNDNYNAWQCDKGYFETQGKCLIIDYNKISKISNSTIQHVGFLYDSNVKKVKLYLIDGAYKVKGPDGQFYTMIEGVTNSNKRHKYEMIANMALPF